MFSGTFSLLPVPSGGTALPGTWTPNQAIAPGVAIIPGTWSSSQNLPAGTTLVSGTWTPSQAQAVAEYYGYPTYSSYPTVPAIGGGMSAYQQPGETAEGDELSDQPLRRLRGIFGEEFSEGSPVQSLLQSRNAALLAIGIFSVLLLRGKQK